MSKPKVVIVNEKLMDYRVPIYNLLAEKYDLTFVHSSPFKEETKIKFTTKKIREAKPLGPIFIHPDNINAICEGFDAAIILGEIRRVSLASLAFRNRKYPMAFWTIGVSTGHGFDVCKRMDWLRDMIYKKADACIFYTDYARERAIRKGYNPHALFVANNTVEVLDIPQTTEKDSFLFIGTLRKGKGLPILLEAYKSALLANPNLPVLNVVGGGPEFGDAKDWIARSKLEDRVRLIGPIYDKLEKSIYFHRAYACISPSQAGLSVLESMGYGVPFVTMYNGHTGGERFNIHDGIDGILMKKESELRDILLDIASEPMKYCEMGRRARKYYWDERRPERMAGGLSDAIEYLLSLR